MIINTIVIVVSTVLIAIALYNKRLQGSEVYKAFSVPFASIMDIGFLAVIPLIVMVMGIDAAFFVLGVVIIAYLMGAVIRYNITHIVHLERDPEGQPVDRLIPISSYVLAGAYAINIAYYLQLLGVLAVALFDSESQLAINLMATAVLATIGVVGFTAGLAKLNALGERIIPINLAVIGGFLFGLLAFNIGEVFSGDWGLPDLSGSNDVTSIRKVLGTLVIVQGFEVSLYLGARFPQRLRNRTMRYAQIISGAIFVMTFALLTVLFDTPTDVSGVGAVIDISGAVSDLLPFLLVFGAIGSQLAASVSNVAGGSSLLVATIGERLRGRVSYQFIVVPAIALTWLTNINQVIALASRAFAAYYAIECLIAIRISLSQPAGRGRNLAVAGMGAMALFMTLIAVFSIPT